MGTDLQQLTRKLRAKELEVKILKDLEKVEALAIDKEEFYEKLKELLFKIFKLDFCVLVIKEKEGYSVKNFSSVEDFDPELFIEMAQHLIELKRPLIISSTWKHKRLRKHKLKSVLALGTVKENQEISIILGSRRKRIFKKLEIWKLLVLTNGLANSLDQLKIKEELKSKNLELKVIERINYLRETIPDYEKLITEVLKEVKKELNSEMCYFYLRSKEEKFLVAGKSADSLFFKTNRDVLVNYALTALEENRTKEFNDLNLDIKNGACVPFIISEEVQGVLGAVNADKPNLPLLQTVTKQINSMALEDWEKNQIKQVFSNYVSPEIIEMMLRNNEKDYMKTKKEEITVLFSDIRGFTKLAEQCPPEKIVELLNDYLNTMTEIILKNKGMVDKFIGDSIMAVWGVPVYLESQAFRAIKAAWEMQKAQKKLEQKYSKEGLSFNIGVGINTGEAIVGNVGSKLKMDYTVIGDMVNTASRICSVAKPGQILISENTYREARREIKAIKLKPLEVKNKSYPITVYEVVSVSN